MLRMTVHKLGIAFVASLVGCVPPPPPQTPVFVSATANASVNESSTENREGVPPVASWAAVQVLVDKRVDRPTEVVGVLDFHSDANSEDKGFDELRARAAALGADAVIGAEFEHGEGNEPSHLSGMAVRFLDR
jgi:hypothetical protein